jgi:hypothetical protein
MAGGNGPFDLKTSSLERIEKLRLVKGKMWNEKSKVSEINYCHKCLNLLHIWNCPIHGCINLISFNRTLKQTISKIRNRSVCVLLLYRVKY